MGCMWCARSFTLQAPRLRCLKWSQLFAKRVLIDVGRPGGMTSGQIMFTWISVFKERPKMDFQAQMAKMLEGLLPELAPEFVADVAR